MGRKKKWPKKTRPDIRAAAGSVFGLRLIVIDIVWYVFINVLRPKNASPYCVNGVYPVSGFDLPREPAIRMVDLRDVTDMKDLEIR